jgi:hypothetical protein
MIHNTVVCAPDDLRDQLRKLTRMELIRTLAAWRPDMTDFRNVVSAYRITLRSLARRYLELHDEIGDLDGMINAIVDDLAPDLVAQNCIGHEIAGQLLLTAGDNSERLHSEASCPLRGQSGPGLLRQNNPTSPEPRWRSHCQQCPAHHCHRPLADRAEDQGLRRKTHRPRSLQTRSHSLHQTLHRT